MTSPRRSFTATVVAAGNATDVDVPANVVEALGSGTRARAAFDRLPYGLRRTHVGAIEDAKSASTRERRISKLIATLDA